ncbi:Di-sulfide bridge nucleocytoplasmic transport domain-containing protein [Xylariaceae sp. FL0804]|nr:Di-sulfide bridge nucleocytoplasmic transport domain-containing protein [Xylariaceae sp. FL0804]
MERRTFESPMDWEYQNGGPLDPSSPFVQSTRPNQPRNPFSSSSFSTFGQSPFARPQGSPPKATNPTNPTNLQTPSFLSRNTPQRTTTAPPFRNAAFTTPRKPFDVDMLSEVSAAESSPAATDGSDFQDTPEKDQSYDLGQMTITPSTLSRRQGALSAKKASGKGEIPRTLFSARDKVRKRKRFDADKDISGYRLPYLQKDEWEDSDYESDESTFQPSKAPGNQKKRNQEGWFGNLLAAIQRHPYAPKILGYWLNFAFSLVCVVGTFWIGWAIIAGLREDFAKARQAFRADIMADIDKCATNYRENKCYPIEQRLPAIYDMCEEWYTCMAQSPDNIRNVQLGAKGIVEIVNEIVETMSYKTIALFVLLVMIFLFSGRSLYRNTNEFPDFSGNVPPPAFSQPAAPQHHVYWQAIQPQTPRHFNSRHLLNHNDETPETDGSPPRFKAIAGPQTPATRRSPSKGERGRSPTKSRSPTKRY